MKVLAFYLPQFHPTPENDAWWGRGFTEWTNVTTSRPRFAGHYQPHLPADLGFYDLRLEASRCAQGELARRYGIDGFCYYHDWFNGKRLLGGPVDDARYIKVDGRPRIGIYRAELLPDAARTLRRWRTAARLHGFPDLYVVGVHNNFTQTDEGEMLDRDGFDAVIGFQPHLRHIRAGTWPNRIADKLRKLANAALVRFGADPANPPLRITSVHRCEPLAQNVIAALRGPRSGRVIPCVIPSWDNSPRRADGARVLQNTDPAPYEAWLREAIRAAGVEGGARFVFINAWNEWAEGCHLEPDREVGHGFLQATARVIAAAPAGAPP
jgi:hypothetical protein